MVKFNLNQGNYKPWFFCKESFALSKVHFSSEEKSHQSALGFFNNNHSFTYIRDVIRHIDAYDLDGYKIDFNNFLNRFHLSINSANLFKCGKYLSRIFRSTRYGEHLNNLNIHINKNYNLKLVDGISLISIDLAKRVGWFDVKPNKSAQFTLLFNEGLVKGHCVVSDKISNDVIIYEGNIKKDISFNDGYFVALEPVKLTRKANLDSQTLPNLWELFSPEQYLDWFISSVEKFKSDLVNGKVTDWLDDIDSLEIADLDENFILQKAVRHNIDYRKYPGLMRSAWNMFYKSLVKSANRKDSSPDFRIPILFAYRGYLRIDIRNHDSEGNFTCSDDSFTLDKFGNLWVNQNILIDTFKVLGGADQDDNVAIIPLPENKAVIYRNPNQFGEYQIIEIKYESIEITQTAKIMGSVPVKKIKEAKTVKDKAAYNNKFIQQYFQKVKEVDRLEYNQFWLAKTIFSLNNNEANIGLAANAEMLLASIRIINKKLFNQLCKSFSWDLEKIIDSTVKDGLDVSEQINIVKQFFQHIADNKISIPKVFLNRVPQSVRDKVNTLANHPIDQLYEAIKIIIESVNTEIIGKGIAGKDRQKGLIDFIEVPVREIIKVCNDNPMEDISNDLMRKYNYCIAQLITATEKIVDLVEREEKRKQGIEAIQEKLKISLEEFTEEERLLIVQNFMIRTYLSSKSVHDSIIWNKYISDYAIKLIISAGLGQQIIFNGKAHRQNAKKELSTDKTAIRVWSKDAVTVGDFTEAREVIIIGSKVLLSDKELNLGDECKITDGVYNVYHITQATSKKTGQFLKNSLTILIK